MTKPEWIQPIEKLLLAAGAELISTETIESKDKKFSKTMVREEREYRLTDKVEIVFGHVYTDEEKAEYDLEQSRKGDLFSFYSELEEGIFTVYMEKNNVESHSLKDSEQ